MIDRILTSGELGGYKEALSEIAASYDLGLEHLPGLTTVLERAGPVVRVVAISAEAELVRLKTALASSCREPPLIVLLPHDSRALLVETARLGAAHLATTIPAFRSVLELVLASGEVQFPPSSCDGLSGVSEDIASIRREVARVAPTDATVLITGETGTGKGLLARSIQRCSKRSDPTFVHLDCPSLSSTLIESELFGHEQGAFTGATHRRRGRFESAQRGTIFLDEVGELDLALQSKLLRILQEREFERIGGSETLRMTARTIAATNRDLEQDVERGAFRADLLYRLSVFRIHLPAVRERPEDIPGIVFRGLKKVCELYERPAPHISTDVVLRFMEMPWPGNARQILNTVEALILRCSGDEISLRDAEEFLRPRNMPTQLSLPVEDADDGGQFDAIAGALASSGGNVARAARRLGVPRSTLRHWIRRHRLEHLIPTD